MIAAKYGQTKAVTMLMAAGFDVNHTDPVVRHVLMVFGMWSIPICAVVQDSDTPLITAAANNQTSIVQMFIEAQANVNVQNRVIRKENGGSPLCKDVAFNWLAVRARTTQLRRRKRQR
jgi:ankyrin repeat protein